MTEFYTQQYFHVEFPIKSLIKCLRKWNFHVPIHYHHLNNPLKSSSVSSLYQWSFFFLKVPLWYFVQGWGRDGFGGGGFLFIFNAAFLQVRIGLYPISFHLICFFNYLKGRKIFFQNVISKPYLIEFILMSNPYADSKFVLSILKFFRHSQFFMYTQYYFGILISQI